MISAQSRGEEPDDEGGELEAGGEDAHPSLLRESERHERADEEQEEHAETVLGLLGDAVPTAAEAGSPRRILKSPRAVLADGGRRCRGVAL